MTNTIPNVPRELKPVLAMILNALDRDAADGKQARAEMAAELRAILSAPSPAGVDGLEVVGWYTEDHLDDKSATTYSREVADRWLAKGWPVNGIANAAAAQAIIDGLRGEVASQEETANQWRELALQFDRHRMTAMAHIRAAASGDKSAIEALGVFAALPPIPGHEITAERDQQAQRIGELEAALEFACKALAQVTSSDGSGHADIAVSVLRMAGTKDADALHVVEAYKAGAKWRINAALSAGKEGE